MSIPVDAVKTESSLPDFSPVKPSPLVTAFFDQCRFCGDRFPLPEILKKHQRVCRFVPVKAEPGLTSQLDSPRSVETAQDHPLRPRSPPRVLPHRLETPPDSRPGDVSAFPPLKQEVPDRLVEEERGEGEEQRPALPRLTIRRSSSQELGPGPTGAKYEVVASDGGSDSGMDVASSDVTAPSSINGEPVEDGILSPAPDQTGVEGGDVAAADLDPHGDGMIEDANEMIERIDADDALDPDEDLDPDELDPGEDVDPLGDDPDPDADPEDLPDRDPADDPGEWSSLDPDALAHGTGAISPNESALLAAEAGEEGVPEEENGAVFGEAEYDADGLRMRLSSGEEPGDSGVGGSPSELASDAGASNDGATPVTGDVLQGEEQDDVLRLLDSLNRDGARAAASTPPAPPRLLPMGSPIPSAQQRMTASAPPPPLDCARPGPPRSVSSDPGGGDPGMVAPSLQDIRPLEGSQPPEVDGAQQKQDGGDGQPLIRMAAIAANIPDERSFRHEAATPAPPSLHPRPDLGLGVRPPVPGGLPPQLTPAGVRPGAPGQPPAPGAAGTPVSCFVCQMPMADVRALQVHLLTHQNAMQCSMCPFKANNVNELKAHSVTYHGKMQPGAIGRPPNSNMSAHMASMRPGVPPQPGMAPVQRFPQIRRGRPPLDSNRQLQMQMNGMRTGMPRGGMMPRPGQVMNRHPGISPNKRPAPGMMNHDANKRPRPGIPIQPDKSDCQVIAVQRRQQGVPVIQNVEGSAYSGAGAGIRLSDSITMTVQNAAPSPSKGGSDVASILANRGISITPAAAAPAPAAAQPPLNLPNLPAGISLTPASSSGSDGFAVPRPPSNVQQTSVSRPSRPPTVDLTADTPSMRGQYTCRYCERQLPNAAALAQHEKAHVSGSGGSQNLRCRVCGIVMQNLALLQQHMQQRHGSTLPPQAPGRGQAALAELVVPVFDLGQVSRDQLEALGVRGFIPVSQVNQRQGQLGLPIISLQGLGKQGPSPRPVAFFNLGPVRPLRQ